MLQPHMSHHQATLIIWGDHFVLSTLRHIVIVVVVVVVVVNLPRRIFSCYLFNGRFTVMYNTVMDLLEAMLTNGSINTQ
jgi:hypothetical protein